MKSGKKVFYNQFCLKSQGFMGGERPPYFPLIFLQMASFRSNSLSRASST
jgi:hypothetical protein